MTTRRFVAMSCLLVGGFLLLTACMPIVGSQTGMATATQPGQEQAAPPTALPTEPASKPEPPPQTPGRAQPGAAPTDSRATPEENRAGSSGAQSGSALRYVNPEYDFSLDYPAGFALRARPAEDLARLLPKPVTALMLINPTMAASDVVELADLEIRVHSAGQGATLDNWLAVNDLSTANGSTTRQPFKTANVSGAKVCLSTMIVPNCYYFVMGSRWVYQLIPASVEGEALVNSFAATP